MAQRNWADPHTSPFIQQFESEPNVFIIPNESANYTVKFFINFW